MMGISHGSAEDDDFPRLDSKFSSTDVIRIEDSGLLPVVEVQRQPDLFILFVRSLAGIVLVLVVSIELNVFPYGE